MFKEIFKHFISGSNNSIYKSCADCHARYWTKVRVINNYYFSAFDWFQFNFDHLSDSAWLIWTQNWTRTVRAISNAISRLGITLMLCNPSISETVTNILLPSILNNCDLL